jgi:hypothetical protein
MYPGISRARVVDSGRIITGGGIASGMEVGFHLLRRAGYGEDFITEVARIMEYTAEHCLRSRRRITRNEGKRFLDFAHAAAARHVLDGKRYRLVRATRSNGCADCGGGWSGGAG